MSGVYRMGRRVEPERREAQTVARQPGSKRQLAQMEKRQRILDRARSMVDLSAAQRVSAQGPASGDVDL